MHHLPTAQSPGQPAEGSGNLHTSVCDSRQSLTLCQDHNSPGKSFSRELGPSRSLLTADKGVIPCLGPVLHPLHIPFQKPISHMMINSEEKRLKEKNIMKEREKKGCGVSMSSHKMPQFYWLRYNGCLWSNSNRPWLWCKTFIYYHFSVPQLSSSQSRIHLSQATSALDKVHSLWYLFWRTEIISLSR